MAAPSLLSEAEHRQVSGAVAAAEARSSGEIVTIVADRSDDYGAVALAWSVLASFVVLTILTLAPDAALALVDRLAGGWTHDWTPRAVLATAATSAMLAFALLWVAQLWPGLRLALVPGPLKAERVRDRAVACFRIGAERRTEGRTGILIYLSLREHRAEIVADAAIASQVAPEVWGEAMAAMLAELKQGRMAAGMIAAVEQVGAVLAEHLPPTASDRNELPDRLIEV
jgi:putative membrane protein